MIQLSEVFKMIGVNGCQDVATSLSLQGTDPEISIPIYEIFYLKLLSGEHTGFLAGNIPEYNALRRLAQSCGGVAAAINLLDMDILTLIGVEIICTPNTGMNVFMKLGEVLTGELEEEVIHMLASLANIPIPEGAYDAIEFVGEVIQILFDKLIENLGGDLEEYGINLRPWEELPMYYSEINENGDIQLMQQYRQSFGGAIL